MKRTVTFLISVMLFASMVVLGGASKMQAQNTQGQNTQGQPCSLSTLQGTYGALITGFFQGNPPPTFATPASNPSAMLNIATFNGAGGFVAEQVAASNNGMIQPRSQAFVGTYSVNPDCTGSSTIGGATSDLVIVDNGKKVQALVTNLGSVQSGIATRIDVLPCSLATLQGTYGAPATGFFQFGNITAFQPFAQIGNITADGAGGATGQFAFSANGAITPFPVPAQIFTYNVASDCTGTVTLFGGTSPAVSFVIVGNGKEFLAIQTIPGTVVSAIGIKQ